MGRPRISFVIVAQGATTRYGVHLKVDRVKGTDVHWNAQVSDAPLSDG